jgi:O-antigen/teichoic acid export membrane protein
MGSNLIEQRPISDNWGIRFSVLLKSFQTRTKIALVDQALVSGSNFATNVLMARVYGPRGYGVFALLWIAVLFINSLQFALVVTPMMSVAPKQSDSDRASYFGAVVLQALIFVGISGLLMYLSMFLSPRFFPQWGVGYLAVPMMMVTMAYLLQDFLRRYFFCIGKKKAALIIDALSYLTQLPLLFWAAKSQPGSLSLAIWVIAATSIAAVVLGWWWFEPVVFDRDSFWKISSRHWQISRWIAPTAFMQWGSGNLFLLAAPIYYGPAASGLLRATQNIVGVAHIWFLGLDNIVPPEAARQLQLHGVKALMAYIKKIIFTWGGITLGFCAIVAAFPNLWLHIVYGAKYNDGATLLRLYALLYLITFISSPLRAALVALEYTSPIFWAYPALIVFSVALAGPFARTLGLNGVILGMCATQIIFQGIVGSALLIRARRVDDSCVAR